MVQFSKYLIIGINDNFMAKYSGNFGTLAAQYDALRPTYPKKALSLIFKSIEESDPVILDLGCGTGISTRQLAKIRGTIFGCDIDSKMLKVARSNSTDVRYIEAQAERLPFENKMFDCVTAFIAFHWFMNKKSIRQIKRVLKRRGVLCIIQPRFVSFQKDYRIILEKELKLKIPKKYKTSAEIIPFLEANGFSVKKYMVKPTTKYTLNEYIELLKSYSLWNFVPTKRKKEVENLLKKYFRTKLRNGYIRNVKDIEVIIAKTEN
jgi:ubiquinone/menaquinone biosynthesis C-methylase UbiE